MPRVFESVCNAVGVAIVVGIIAIIVRFFFCSGLAWGAIVVIVVSSFIVGFIGFGMKYLAMSDEEYLTHQIETEEDVRRSRESWAEAGRRVQQKQISKKNCRNCDYYYEVTGGKFIYGGRCSLRCRPYSSDEAEEVQPDYVCKYFIRRDPNKRMKIIRL